MFNQAELNNFVRDLNLTKMAAKILAARHKEKKTCLIQTYAIHFTKKENYF